MKINNIKLLRCSNCKVDEDCKLILDKNNAETANGYIFSGELFCKECQNKYFITNGIPNLLLPEVRDLLEKRRFLQFRETLNKLKKTNETFNDYESVMDNTHLLVEEIKAAENMASGYRRYVADFCGSAPSSATGFEKYEDLMLRKIIDQYVKNNKKLVFIEVGSGPGRYLLRYGAKISTNKDSCKKYRDHADLQRFYKYDKDYEENLQLIIGIDFSESMIKNAQEWLKENDLQNLVYNDRILQIIADIQNLNLSFKDTPYEHSYKVVACLFQTIGNQLNHQLRVNLVKKMMELVKPYGTILISAFHKDVFSEFIPKYYQKIIPSIGKITFIDKEKGTLKTKKGVFSHWFSPEEIKNILRDANINKNKITIKTGNDLPLFRKDVDYVSLGDQEDIRKRAIFAIIDV